MTSKESFRFNLGIFFFISGFCFSSWTSRIPSIKMAFGLNDAALGTILLAMPVSSMIGLPISGWLVSRFDSRVPLTIAFVLNAIGLILIGMADSIGLLVAAICLFAFSMRIFNIAINTQALTLQKIYQRKINGVFHGLWSTGGIAGIALSTVLVAFQMPMSYHLFAVATVCFLVAAVSSRYLIRNDRAPSGNKLALGRPDPFILYLGALVFFAALCEGGMFDWSGVFFREVVKEELFTTGYLIFMSCMALVRFVSDCIIDRIGMGMTYLISALLIASGIALALIFPYFIPAMVGFSLVGLGTGPVIPMTYSLAGTSSRYSAGMAVSMIATYGIAGMLLGPPLIGYISHVLNLQVSFIIFALAGLMFIPLSRSFFRMQEKEREMVNTE